MGIRPEINEANITKDEAKKKPEPNYGGEDGQLGQAGRTHDVYITPG